MRTKLARQPRADSHARSATASRPRTLRGIAEAHPGRASALRTVAWSQLDTLPAPTGEEPGCGARQLTGLAEIPGQEIGDRAKHQGHGFRFGTLDWVSQASRDLNREVGQSLNPRTALSAGRRPIADRPRAFAMLKQSPTCRLESQASVVQPSPQRKSTRGPPTRPSGTRRFGACPQ